MIEVAGLRLRVWRRPGGTDVLEVEGPLRPLSLFLMHVIPEAVEALVDAVERDAAFDKYPAFGFPLEPGDDLARARATWLELTGTELGDDVYHIALVWGPQLYLPRATLIEVVRTMAAVCLSSPSDP